MLVVLIGIYFEALRFLKDHSPRHDEVTDPAESELLVWRLQNGHGDEGDVGVGWLNQRTAGGSRAISAAGTATADGRRLYVAVIAAHGHGLSGGGSRGRTASHSDGAGGATSGAFDKRRRKGDTVVQSVHGIRAGVHFCGCSL